MVYMCLPYFQSTQFSQGYSYMRQCAILVRLCTKEINDMLQLAFGELTINKPLKMSGDVL